MKVHDQDEYEGSGDKCKDGGIPTPAETYIEDGTEDRRPEVGGHGHGRYGGDGCLGDMLRGQQLRHDEERDAGIQADGGVREAHRVRTSLGPPAMPDRLTPWNPQDIRVHSYLLFHCNTVFTVFKGSAQNR